MSAPLSDIARARADRKAARAARKAVGRARRSGIAVHLWPPPCVPRPARGLASVCGTMPDPGCDLCGRASVARCPRCDRFACAVHRDHAMLDRPPR